jgi:hypothetical protein
MANQREEAPQSRPPLPDSSRDFLFAYLLTHPAMFGRAMLRVTDECFSDGERGLRLVWNLARQHYSEHGELPGKDLLLADINAELELDPEALTDDDISQCDDLIGAAFALVDQPSYARTASIWLRHFLEDRLMQQARNALLLPHTPTEVSSMFTGLANKAAELRAVSENNIPVPFEEGWDEVDAVTTTTSTGLSIFDSFMGGGDARGETYGLLAPFGGGKTTISTMITCEKALAAYVEWERNGCVGVCGRAYHFAYEDKLQEVRMRALCYLSRIPLTRLTEIVGARAYDRFSTIGRYEEYERIEYRDSLVAGIQPSGERERYAYAIQVLNRCWRCIYMGGTLENPLQGTKLVDEVAAIVAQDLAYHPDVRVDVVLTDYVLAAVRRYLQATGKDFNQLRHYLVLWPNDMRHKIATPFNCPTWSMQQLSGEANKMKPGQVMSSLDAGEAKGFPENCNFCFAIGKMNRDQMATFTCDKHRRQGMADPIVVWLDGEHAIMRDMRRTFTIDARTRTILSNDDARRLGGRNDEAERTPARRGAGNVINQQQGLGVL